MRARFLLPAVVALTIAVFGCPIVRAAERPGAQMTPATVSVNLPLFAWGARFSKLKAAREKQAAADAASRQIQLQTQAAAAAALAQLQAALARLDEARTHLGYCRIVAPMDGLIARRLTDPGDLAVPGKPLFQLVHQDRVRVRASLPPEDWTRRHVGQVVTLTWKGHALKVAVSRVFPAMNDSQLATIEVDLAPPPAGFVFGATVGVDVAMNLAQGLAVPADALLEGDRGDWVFVVKNGAVRPVSVAVCGRSYTQVVVTGDLTVGDAVVEAEPSQLMTLAAGAEVVEVGAPQLRGEKTR